MRRLALLLVPAALFGGPARYARLGEFEGKVEVQLQAAEPWVPAQRNLPLPEGAWLRTASASKLEVEFDDGGAFRLGPDSLAEISDQSRLSTGQRVTLLSLDHGLAYFTGQPEGQDSLALAIPGAQVTVRRGVRLRLEATDQWSQVAAIEGAVRFSSPAAEFDLAEGQTARVEPAHSSRFFLYREISPVDLDRWNEQRDRTLAAATSGRHVPVSYGMADLDAAGEWIETDDLGAVWKPRIAEGWVPYRNGRWRWYDAVGYAWISDDPWGWAPYHYGRWARRGNLGWVWVPSKRALFKPGEVYWLRGSKLAGWGPLAPGEEWSPKAPPQQFLNANTTWAEFQQDARIIDPTSFSARPKEPLGVAAFTLALPSPAFVASRLDAVRPTLRAGSTRVVPVISGVTYNSDGAATSAAPGPAPREPVAVVTNPGTSEPPVVVVESTPPPPPPPQEIVYPVPVYTGVIVVNPPEKRDGRGWRRTGPGQAQQPQPPAVAPAPTPAPAPVKVAPRAEPSREDLRRRVPAAPAPAPVAPQPPVVRSEPVREHHGRPAAPAPAAPAPAQPAAPPAVRSEPVREHHGRPPAPPADKPADSTPESRAGRRSQ